MQVNHHSTFSPLISTLDSPQKKIVKLHLTLSLTHTHTLSRTPSLSLSPISHTHTHTLTLSLSLSHTHTHTLFLWLTHLQTHTHTSRHFCGRFLCWFPTEIKDNKWCNNILDDWMSQKSRKGVEEMIRWVSSGLPFGHFWNSLLENNSFVSRSILVFLMFK